MEKECKIHGLTEFTLTSGRYKCKKCIVEAVQKRRDKIKQMALYYKGGKCEKCGYNKCISALEFHHLDSNEKDFSISSKGYTRSWESVKAELDKCILVCSNCHREIHHESPKNIFTEEELRKAINKSTNCDEEIDSSAKNFNYKVPLDERPTKKQLLELILSKSFTEVGKIYGVSDNAIRKWCKSYGLPYTKKELKQLYQ